MKSVLTHKKKTMKPVDFEQLKTNNSSLDCRREQESRSYAQGDTIEFKPMSQTEHFELILARIEEERKDITADEQDWANILLGIATTFGETGRNYAQRISQFWYKDGQSYDPREVDTKYDWCLQNGRGSITIASVIQIAKDYGIDVSMPEGCYPEGTEPPRRKAGRPKKAAEGKKKNTATAAIELLTEKFRFRYNTMTEGTEYIPANDSSKPWKPLGERDTDTLLTEMHTRGINVARNNLISYINSEDIAPEYNPGKEYLASLPKWDPSKPDYIGQLFGHIQIDNSDGYIHLRIKLLRKWFLNLTSCINGECNENQLVPNFRGKQGTGKTYFAKQLLPPQLRTDYCITITPGSNWTKDDMLALSTCYLANLDEWEADKKSNDFYKALISLDKTKIRSPYAHKAKTRHRVASFIANGNDEICLIDPQGSRRFITCTVLGTTNLNEDPLPLDGAYAQALYLISQPGFQHSLTKEEIEETEKLNQQYIAPDVVKEAIQTIYRIPRQEEKGTLVTTADIIERLACKQIKGYDITSASIGKRMKELGFAKKSYHNKARYYVQEIQFQDYDAERHQEGERYYNELLLRQKAEEETRNAAESLF